MSTVDDHGPGVTSDAVPDEASSLAAALDRYRHTREQLERSIWALATSVDGHAFQFHASLHDLELRTGGYVVLESGHRSHLGQIIELDVQFTMAAEHGLESVVGNVMIRLARGTGVVLDPDAGPFHDARVRPATSEEVAAWFDARRPRRAALEIGELVYATGVPARLDSGGFNRHSFMCGQSGSGKTYSLGLLLERLLAETRLRVVILDPNSDYVGLGRIRDGADPDLAARYEAVPSQVAVWSDPEDSADLPNARPLRLRFRDLEPTSQSAVLGLHPVADRDEYAILLELLRGTGDKRVMLERLEELLHSDVPGARGLGLRARNLGVLEWSIWDPEARSLVEELRSPTSRCTVVDLGSLETVGEQRLVAATVLSTLWATRYTRDPCLLVVDEAHNICPADPPDTLSRYATDVAVQIAAEGRKYGRYLLTSTQRPHKVHENVVSQCDNLLLMRMNSNADVADLSRLFSFVPAGLMAGATHFRMGQALVAGRILPQPAYVQMGTRVSREGGADVPTTWAEVGEG